MLSSRVFVHCCGNRNRVAILLHPNHTCHGEWKVKRAYRCQNRYRSKRLTTWVISDDNILLRIYFCAGYSITFLFPLPVTD